MIIIHLRQPISGQAVRTEDLHSEAGSKAVLKTLIGVLTAEMSVKNIKGFVEFLGDRLQDKAIKIQVKVGDREAKIEAKSRKELLDAKRVALELLDKMSKEGNV